MLLSRLQSLIGGIYDVSVAHDVYDFLVTDRRRLPHGARGGTAEEELIVAEPADGTDEVGLSLYLDPALLARLTREDPLLRRQFPQHFPAELRRVLFERTRVDPRAAAAGRADLYREASRYAHRFCARLERLLARGRASRHGGAADDAVLPELRRFYRLTHARKRALIEGIG